MENGPRTPQDETRAVAYGVQRILFLANETEREVGRLLGLRPTDYRALSTIMQAGPMTVGGLASAVGATYATTTALATRLEAAGHLRRARDDADRRKVRLHVEQATAARVLDLMRGPMEATTAYVTDLTEPDRAAVAAFTTAVAGALADHLHTLTDAERPGARPRRTRPTRKDRS
ncbi:MarR family transcriptional regulator [Agilicoccus flavus]|uniref:MarR family transcriptional regulator n=1 Tax=Agilicoccus flavus TaxID=2775968 RepID=UPI001CF70CBE|nr:MarR family transcriptional regulator [Agilicoccus flavus]